MPQISTWFMANRDPDTGYYPDLPPEEAGGSRDIIDPPPPPPPAAQPAKPGRGRQRIAESAAEGAAGGGMPQSAGATAATAQEPLSATAALTKPAAKSKKGMQMSCQTLQSTNPCDVACVQPPAWMLCAGACEHDEPVRTPHGACKLVVQDWNGK